ncbi:MAG: FG-GAP-like repeat-containing protein [Muribaculaceae bacterium]|nr:FG-GAP-like repeat-containing protein [Muribaculaceae bacterium]
MRGKILFLVRDVITWDSPYATRMEEWHETDNLASGWELRGRIYPTKPGTTNRYDRRATSLLVQDFANAYGEENANKKKEEAKKIFDFLENRCPTTPHNMVWTFNFSSGYNNDGTSHATGYADNANSMNPYFMECLEQSNGPAGMVMIDFVGADEHSVYKSIAGGHVDKTTYGLSLTHAVVEQNFKYIDRFVSCIPHEVKFNNHSWAGTLWGHMFYGNNLFADVNGNGYMDYVIASAQQNGGSAMFVTNNGNGGFNFMNEDVFGTNYGNHIVVPIDFDNDGDIDFLVFHNGASAELQQNDGNGSFSKIENIGIGEIVSLSEDEYHDGDWHRSYNFDSRAVVLDVNHDGFKDVVLYDNNGDVKVYVGNGNGSFAATDTNMPNIRNGKMSIGDYDRDGFADIIISGCGDWIWDNPEIKIALTRPDLNFEVLAPASLQPYAVFNGDVMFVDMNMDGLLDVFVNGMCHRWGDGRYDAYRAALLINKGNDEFEKADVLIDPMRKCSADWADLTGNGRPDIVYTGENYLGYYTSTVINYGNGNYKAESTMDGHRASPSIATCDYRGVGRASIAVMGHSWDSKANQLYDVESTIASYAKPRRAAGMEKAEIGVVKGTSGNSDTGLEIVVLNADEMPAGTRYNYVIKMNDGSTISNVPLNKTTGTPLIADVNGSTTATVMNYPSVNVSDISSVGVQVVDGDKTMTPLSLISMGEVTGVDQVVAEDVDAPVEYYNLQGQRVLNPTKGIFIERRGSKTTKVIL